ncbi:MAG: hypothetical protein JEZ09_15725 [Salinivirgaceae bacterium]|nr:hypothetical protein [Salinivirgaceae bacterium]
MNLTFINIGLIIDIIGVILLYLFGMPEALFNHGNFFHDFRSKEDISYINMAKYLSILGIILLIVGFALQIIGNNFTYFSNLL